MFLEKIRHLSNVEVIEESDVSHIKIDNEEYYLYFKCVTHEGNPYPLEHQRAQLPRRESFERVKASAIPFLFIGYDVVHDVYVTWEPSKVKPRLNKRTYVSFYSRLSIQESVVEGEIRDERLTNGDKFVLFKSSDILSFFQMIDQHFPELRKDESCCVDEPKSETSNDEKTGGTDIIGRISNIDDDESVKFFVDSHTNSSKLAVVAACMNEFGMRYFNMTLTDWYKVIERYLSNPR